MKQSLTLSLLAAFLLATSGVFAEVDQEKSQTIQKSTDEAYLIQTLENIGDSEDDIYYGNIACKRLAVYGTDAAIPTLVKMLASEKQNFNARFALEAMPGDAVNPVLEKAAQELSGYCLVGVIDTLGVRKDANAVAIFKDILASNKDVKVTKAIYAALGSIANDDAIAILLEEAKTIADRAPITVNKYDENTLLAAGLADAILDCADACEIAGNTDKAIELFDAVINPAFPVFNQKAGSYRGLLARDAAAVELLISKMKSEKCCCFVSGLKSIREYSDNASESIVKALVDVLPELSEDRQVLVIRALGDRCDEVSQKLTFPVLDKAITSGSNAVKIAAMRALVHVANVDIKRAAQLCADFAETFKADDAALEFAIFTATNVQNDEVDAIINSKFQETNFANVADEDVALYCALLKIVENRRILATAEGLVKIADTEGINPKLRDAALSALSEIVALDNLNLLVAALNGEQDDAKVDWILRAACTRLPREECAAKVVEMYKAADLEGKGKILPLLKQIGGPTALACVVDACWQKDTADQATQVLGSWNSPDDIMAVADACLKLARESKDNKYRVRGIRSYIRVPRQFNMEPAKRFEMCKIAFETAKRPEDRVLIFEVFKRVIEVASVNAALEYADMDQYREDACDAAIFVAEKIQGTSPELQAAMKTLIEKTENKDIKDRAQKVLERK